MPSPRVELLRQVPLFREVSESELERIASSLRERTFPAGETVASEGSGGVGFFVVEDGEARVTVGGQERGRLGRGDYFGEIALVTGSDRTATVTAETDFRCLGMTSWEFRPLVQENASLAWNLLEALANKLAASEQRGSQ